MRNFLILFTVIALVLVGCGKEPPTTPEVIEVIGVTLDKDALSLFEGTSAKLTATVKPTNAENKAVTWKSDKTDIATVDTTGIVTAVKEGTATITVTTDDGGKTDDCTVTITAATGVMLDKDAIELEVGSEATLTATIVPTDAEDKGVSWKSDRTDIATVDANGKVAAVKAGIATITVTTDNGGKTDNCIVKVTEKDVLAMIPDKVFLDYCRSQMNVWDANVDGKLSLIEAAAVTRITCSLWDFVGDKIASMEGLEYFTGLTVLQCYGHRLITLDISKNTKLVELDCRNNLGTKGIFPIKAWFDNDAIPPGFPTNDMLVYYYTGDTPPIPTDSAQITLLDSSIDPDSRLLVYQATHSQFEDILQVYENHRITNQIYEKFNDDFDFIFMIRDVGSENMPKENLGYVAACGGARLSVQGIGMRTAHNIVWGSEKTLQTVQWFPYYDMSILNGPSLHEIMHTWGAYIYRDIKGSGAEWGLYTYPGGQLGGPLYVRAIEENSGGIAGRTLYRTGYYPDFRDKYGDITGRPYSNLELYLMGMKSPQELRNANFTLDIYTGTEMGERRNNGYDFWATGKESYTIDDIIADYGPRIPDYADSQKEFKVLTVFVVDETYDEGRCRQLIQELEWLSGPMDDRSFPTKYNFKQATLGRGTLITSGIKNSLKPETRKEASRSTVIPTMQYDYQGNLRIDWIYD
jgi:hypothetical protein